MSQQLDILAREQASVVIDRPAAAPAATSVAGTSTTLPHHIVIVGGGAGGLVLASKLGDRLGRRGEARITLVDAALSHIWKPLLHEVAAGTLRNEPLVFDKFAQARAIHYSNKHDRKTVLKRARKENVLDTVAVGRGLE
jgi:NADH dehydrogenase